MATGTASVSCRRCLTSKPRASVPSTGGAQAAGRGTGTIAVGQPADLMALDMAHVDLEGLAGDTILDSFAFAGGSDMVADVWAGGRHVVQGGRHVAREDITAAYRRAVRDLRASA